VLTPAVKNGKACTGPTDCLPGEGACPTTTTTTTTTPLAGSGTVANVTNTQPLNKTANATNPGADTTATTTAAADASADDQSSAGQTVGIVIGVLVLLTLIIVALLHTRKKKHDLPQAIEVRQRRVAPALAEHNT
jgi:hypothetical protein